MLNNGPVGTVFHEGDQVVLAEGTYQGDLGVFVRLKDDFNWADIMERDGSVRSHPVAWLRRFHGADPRLAAPTPAEPQAP